MQREWVQRERDQQEWGQHWGLPLCSVGWPECRFDWRCVSCRNGCNGNGCSGNGTKKNGGSRNGYGKRHGCGRRQANSRRPTQPELTPIRVLWVGLSRCFSCRRFLCGSSQWCPGRQQVISTEGPLLPAREWFDPVHMYAGVGTCGHDVQFRTPPVLDLAAAEDTVSQVNQVTNVLSVGPTADVVVRPNRWSTGSCGSWPNRRKWGENPVEA